MYGLKVLKGNYCRYYEPYCLDSKLKGNTLELGIKTPILRKRIPCPLNLSSLGWSCISLSPPPQRIGLCNSPFWAHRLSKTQIFPSAGGESPIHVLTTRWASFVVSVKIRHSHQEGGCLAFTARQRSGRPLPWSISCSRLDNALGLIRHGVFCVCGSTTRWVYVFISVYWVMSIIKMKIQIKQWLCSVSSRQYHMYTQYWSHGQCISFIEIEIRQKIIHADC